MESLLVNARRAFTLIEMLVVISIITLLLSIALPSLSKSKMIAREAICGSNMRQATISFTSYSNDNNQVYPDFSYDPATKSQWSNPNYWTQGYWREHMQDYGLLRELFYSPSNEVWNRNDFYWYGSNTEDKTREIVMGYFYFGSSVVNTSAYRTKLKVVPPAGVTNVFPRRNGAVSHTNLIWADLNRQLSDHFGVWLTPSDNRRWGSNHWYGRPDQKVDGSHRAFTDNHVEWVTEPEFRWQSDFANVRMYW